MLFLFKKLVGPFFFPQALCIELLTIGVLLLWLSSRQKLAKTITTIAASGLFLLSYPILWGNLVFNLESAYPPLNLKAADLSNVHWVVVLGGGGEASPAIPATGQLSSPSLMRLVEGVRIQRALPHSRLLVTGGAVFAGASDSSIMLRAAEILGVSPEDIVMDEQSRDTEEQALEISRRLNKDRFVLVTSALHMTRAMALLTKHGMTPIPAPTDFQVKPSTFAWTPDIVQPSGGGPGEADSLAREYLGIIWAKLWRRI